MADLDDHMVGSWDVRQPGWFQGCAERRQEISAWIRAHGFDTSDVYRVDLLHLDTAAIRVWRYARDAAGFHHVDPDTGEIVELPPTLVALRVPPPAWAA